jgi:hypothetical protein
MAEESVEGVAYLRALKRLDDPAAATTPAQESAATKRPNEDRLNYIGDEGDPGARFKGVEKRRSHRYNCEGNAELREERRDVRTWATFQDVSLHGCYMEVQATYPGGYHSADEIGCKWRSGRDQGRGAGELSISRHGHRFPGNVGAQRGAIARVVEQNFPANGGHASGNVFVACLGCDVGAAGSRIRPPPCERWLNSSKIASH